jgi:uncharacterized protein YneF (UPF0154 family)
MKSIQPWQWVLIAFACLFGACVGCLLVAGFITIAYQRLHPPTPQERIQRDLQDMGRAISGK